MTDAPAAAAPLDDEALVAAQRDLPRATSVLPGTGGALSPSPDDFEVEELATFEPEGHGEHLHLWIEKRGLDSRTLFRHLATALEIDERDVGYLGLKDAQAVTRQWISVPARCEPRLAAVESDRLHVLRRARDPSKLRTGHLEGNRFRVVLRGVAPGAAERARAIAAALATSGMPNYFGPQRFGRDGDTLRRGLALLRGREPVGRGGFMLRLALSAAQSALFNVHLADRLRRGSLLRVETGEVLLYAATGGPFIATDPEAELGRLAHREVVPSGPMYGPKMRAPTREPGARERELLARTGLTMDDFARFGRLLAGTRRALIVWPEVAVTAPAEDRLELTFTLPAGSYATVLLGEITKGEAVRADEPEG